MPSSPRLEVQRHQMQALPAAGCTGSNKMEDGAKMVAGRVEM
jgi:hypothetical protein